MKGPLRVFGLGFLLFISIFIWQSSSPTQANAIFEASNGGFHYPFAGTGYVSQNERGLSHNSPALDFIRPSIGNFEVLAPKDGVVLEANDSAYDTWTAQGYSGDAFKECRTKIQAATNYVVLGHGYKGNGEYEFYTMYYHLKSGSIPDYLQRGEILVRTGTVLGQAGTTGYSSATHLHFVGSSKRPQMSWASAPQEAHKSQMVLLYEDILTFFKNS